MVPKNNDDSQRPVPLMKTYRSLRNFFETYPWLVETLFAFIVLNAVNTLAYPRDIGFLHMALHPYWIVVLLMSAQYGFGAGVLSGLIAMLHILFFSFGTLPDRLRLEEFAETGGLLLPISLLSAGVVLGGIRERQIGKETAQAEKCETLQRERDRLAELQEASEKARRILEAKVVGQSTTMKTLYEEVRKLETLNRGEVYRGCLDILAAHFQVEKSSIYLREGDYYILKMARGWDSAAMAEGKVPVAGNVMNLAIEERKMLTVQDVIRRKDASRYEAQFGRFLAMVPLFGQGEKAEGVINIEKIDFMAFNRANLELIDLVANWTSRAIGNIDYLERLKKGSLYDAADGIFNYSYLEEFLAKEIERNRISRQPLTIAFVKLERFGFLNPEEQAIVQKAFLGNLKHRMSAIDSVFNYRYGGTYVLISPSRTQGDADAVLRAVGEETQKIGVSLSWGSVQWHEGMKGLKDLMEPAMSRCGVFP